MNGPFYEKGRYECEITQQAMTKASTGNPQFVLRFRVISRIVNTNQTETVPQQYERTSYRAITDKSMQYLERDLETLGFTGNSLRELDPNNSVHQNFVGKVCDFNCNHEKDLKGDLREKWGVAWSNYSDAIEGDAVDPATYRQLDAMFGRNKKPSSQPAKAAAPRSNAVTEENPITDDDIPF